MLFFAFALKSHCPNCDFLHLFIITVEGSSLLLSTTGAAHFHTLSKNAYLKKLYGYQNFYTLQWSGLILIGSVREWLFLSFQFSHPPPFLMKSCQSWRKNPRLLRFVSKNLFWYSYRSDVPFDDFQKLKPGMFSWTFEMFKSFEWPWFFSSYHIRFHLLNVRAQR